MREIKFRAWHPDLKRMFYDCRVSSEDWLDNSTHFCGEHNTLMQFTGLKDKNGKEIYEGDIVSLMPKDYFIPWKMEVRWYDSFACFGFLGTRGAGEGFISWDKFLGGASYDSIKVIGNIYENPELLT